MEDRIAFQGLTFDDVLLEPGYSEIMPSTCDLSSSLTRNISLNTPVVSSPMDTVTTADMAIAMAQLGGIGIIHKNMSLEEQAQEVYRVKRSEHGIIVDPVTLPPETSVVFRPHSVLFMPNQRALRALPSPTARVVHGSQPMLR